MISIRPFAVGVLALGVSSCTVGPEVREGGPIGPWVLSAGTGTPTASSRFGCTLSVSVGLPDSVPENWDGLAHSSYRRYTDTLSRELDGRTTQFYMRGYGTDSVQIVITSEVRSDTLRGTTEVVHGARDVRGAWDCGPDFPFAADSALVAAGQDSLAVKNGQWQLVLQIVYFD